MFHQIFALIILPIAVMIGGSITAWVHRRNLAKRRASRNASLSPESGHPHSTRIA